MFTTRGVWEARHGAELRQRVGSKPLTHAVPRRVEAGEKLVVLGVTEGWANVRLSDGAVVQLWAHGISWACRERGPRGRYEVLADLVHDPGAGA